LLEDGEGPFSIELVTLGDTQLLVDGEPVRCAMRRSLEVIAFVALHPQVEQAHLRAALVPKDSALAAVNYLNQVRQDLARQVPGPP
jgi:energy-converting hydrogenase A subunit M